MKPELAFVHRIARGGPRGGFALGLKFGFSADQVSLWRGHKRCDWVDSASYNRQALTGSRRPMVLFFSVVSVIVLAAGAIASIRISGIADTSSAPIGGALGSKYKCSVNGSTATNRVPLTGAAANGTGDDSAAIQNAINSAAQRGGGVVTLPAGTFTIGRSLVLKDNVKLTGVGSATVIKAGPNFLAAQGPEGGYPIVSTAGAVDVTIANLTADQSGNLLNGNVAARLAGYVVEGRNSDNIVIDNVYVRNAFTYSIAIAGSSNFCVENSDVQVTTSNRYNQLDGIHILDSSWGQVINNTVTSGDDGLVAHTIGAPVDDVLYAGNKVRGGADADGIQLAVGNFPIYNIKIENNDFYGSLFGIRTGYYDNGTGAVHNISIVGNYVHDLAQGKRFPAIKIGGFGGRGPVENVTVTNNRICRASTVTVKPGSGNRVAGTTNRC